MEVEHLVSFGMVVFVQLVFFLGCAFHLNKQRKIIKYLLLSMLIGLPFGICFDLLIGEYLGIFTYKLGFISDFLIINAVLSYGLMISTLALIKNLKIIPLYLWTVLIGCVYELINYLSPVWEWTFGSAWYEYMVVVGAAYFGLSVLMILCMKIVGFGKR